MSIWFSIPSARLRQEANLALIQWRERGYKIALWRDTEEDLPICDLLLTGAYPGYGQAVNALAKEVLARDKECDWIVTGGDDVFPDRRSPKEIAQECTEHFGGTFGVMQPTGDRWSDGSIDRICGSPWFGREFCERMYGGKGPMCELYAHMFADEEVQNVAIRLGVLWQRKDLTHLHNHYYRTAKNGVNHSAAVPAHVVRWNSREHWDQSKRLFQSRRENRFPGHEPLPRKVRA